PSLLTPSSINTVGTTVTPYFLSSSISSDTSWIVNWQPLHLPASISFTTPTQSRHPAENTSILCGTDLTLSDGDINTSMVLAQVLIQAVHLWPLEYLLH